ncbi:primosomal protein N' [Hamadaea tsunoensis]|uniref:primosomal protein N' n=1 Tax=Hamadaea tsunoensis TaxID=53368 RepID=UPI00042212F8|nr:primosomal protein N' [Hamadaea tsunoensis]
MTKRADRQPAMRLPVARICVDVALPHLDRVFDYQVPEDLSEAARPGTRVKVRFSGKLLDGWLLERADATEHAGKLAWLEKVVSGEPVLRPEIVQLAREIADRYAGNLTDVLRLAVPPRHAAVEKGAAVKKAVAPAEPDPVPRPEIVPDAPAVAEVHNAPSVVARSLGIAVSPVDTKSPAPGSQSAAGEQRPAPAREQPSAAPAPAGQSSRAPETPVRATGQAVRATGPAAKDARPIAQGGWGHYPSGQAFLRALADGKSPRAVWSALPGEQWPARIATAVAETVASGRGAVVVVADARDLDRLDAALTAELGEGRHAALSAALGPAERYRRFLTLSRGEIKVAIGTRAAAFAPVEDLGLVCIWDDGDDLHAEPRAPYPHARQVLLSRAQLTGCAVLVGGFARSAEAQLLLETGWAKEIAPVREALRVVGPRIVTADDRQLGRDPGAVAARLPSLAWQAARESLHAGNAVLVQVPRRGYVPVVSCQDCRERARCVQCSGPLSLPGQNRPAACRWCARPAADFTCPRCGGHRLRAAITGVRRTAEELGRALPGVPVRTSGGETVLASVPDEASLVLATPGAEPVVDGGGYGAVLLLDTWALLTRADLRAAEEALRRWMTAAALALPASRGGTVVVVADGALVPVQALLRWDPGWLAARELTDRRELGFPPAARMASLTGSPAALQDFLAATDLPAGSEQLGPLELPEHQERLLVRVKRSDAASLAHALHAAAGVRSARKAPEPVRVQLDPLDML